MFDQMNFETRKKLVSFCCAGWHCHGDDPTRRVFFQFLAGKPIKNKLILWLRLGLDEAFVKNTEPPSNDEAHWRVVEDLIAHQR
jgi:hypothetical protein